MIPAWCLASGKYSPFHVEIYKAGFSLKQRNDSLDSCNLSIHQRGLIPNSLSPINDRNLSTLAYCASKFTFLTIVRRLQYNEITRLMLRKIGDGILSVEGKVAERGMMASLKTQLACFTI